MPIGRKGDVVDPLALRYTYMCTHGGHVAQLTIYIPDELEQKIRERATREGKSLSALVAEITRAALDPDAWSQAFLDLYGSWEGEFPEPEDSRPESRDSL